MICRRFIDLIPGYLEDALAPEVRHDFEAHTRDCANCATYLANYRRTIALARQAFPEPDEDAWLREALPELLRAAVTARERPEG